MFRGAVGTETLTEGSEVLAHGSATVYATRGDLQLVVDNVSPEGLGALQVQLEQLKYELHADGLFDYSRKRLIPPYPTKIGVITSPSGSVWHDIKTVITRRYPLVELVLAPTSVQGEKAAGEIVGALHSLQSDPLLDVVIVARGGGSLEDLWPFNEEIVARAIFASRVPVVTGVGHETDETIADMVADHRAPTPSAAAELVVPDRFDLISGIVASQQRLRSGVLAGFRNNLGVVAGLSGRLVREKPDIDGFRLRVDDALGTTSLSVLRAFEKMSERVTEFRNRLDLLRPLNVLRRGYSIVHSLDDSTVVSDSALLKTGDRVHVTLETGGFIAQIISTEGEGTSRQDI